MLEIAADSGGIPRAFLRVGGTSVAGQQLAIALSLGCERIVCLAPSLTREIVLLQHRAEQAGAQFHVIPDAFLLLGLVTATDDVIAFADGLFAARHRAQDLLDTQQCVLVQPVEHGLGAGFERLDINHAAAGAMRIPGRLVERLGELPADCDVVSSLQRLALQAGVRQQELGTIGPGAALWFLARSEADAHHSEPLWISQHIGDAVPSNPSSAIATIAVRAFGPAMLHAGSGSRVLLLAAAVAVLLAAIAGVFGFVSAGLGLCAIGWLLRECGALLSRIESEIAPDSGIARTLSGFAWATDAVLVILFGLASRPDQTLHGYERIFPALMLIVLLRILAVVYQGRWNRWIDDRGVMAVVLLGAVAGGIAGLAAHLGAIVAAGLALLALGTKFRLTCP